VNDFASRPHAIAQDRRLSTRLRASRYGGQAHVRASRYGGQAGWRIPVICGAAYASHLLLDWLGADDTPPRGLQLLWPFNEAWYISGLDVFRQTARRQFLTAPMMKQNAIAVALELAILVPIVAALYLVRVKAVAGLAAKLSSGHHPAQ
jgi:LexA-binding, inner membrane-associated putative hydrolase